MNERERIELIMKSHNLTPSQFADKTGIQRASVSHILSGRNKPSLEVMLKIYNSFPGLDMEWLMTGNGDASAMVGTEPEPILPQQPALPGELFPAFTATAAKEPEKEPEKQKSVGQQSATHESRPERPQRRTAAVRPAKSAETATQSRKIREIRIFYTDGTYETMIPEK